MWPPPKPPPPRAGGRRGAPEPARPRGARPPHAGQEEGQRRPHRLARGWWRCWRAAALFGPPELLQHLTVFLLACVVGWHVIWNVTPALHTPLMSVTNAISGIILIGGMLVLGSGGGFAARRARRRSPSCSPSINVAGGFLVTQRMLRMFRK